MSDREFTCVGVCATVDFTLFLVGPDLLGEISGVGEEACVEASGDGDVGGGDMDVSTGVWVSGVCSHGSVLGDTVDGFIEDLVVA